jgi:hypothetical protein
MKMNPLALQLFLEHGRCRRIKLVLHDAGRVVNHINLHPEVCQPSRRLKAQNSPADNGRFFKPL